MVGVGSREIHSTPFWRTLRPNSVRYGQIFSWNLEGAQWIASTTVLVIVQKPNSLFLPLCHPLGFETSWFHSVEAMAWKWGFYAHPPIQIGEEEGRNLESK